MRYWGGTRYRAQNLAWSCALLALAVIVLGCSETPERAERLIESDCCDVPSDPRPASRLDCPKGSGFRPLTGLHPPERVIITTLPRLVDDETIGPHHVKSARELADVIRASGTGAKLVIAGIDPNDVPEPMQVLEAPPYEDTVEFMLENTGGQPWIQDDFEPGIVGSPPVTALVPMLNNSQWLGEGLGFPVLEDLRFRIPGGQQRYEAGGNVEAYPGGLIAIGTRSRKERGPTELGEKLLDGGALEIVRPYTGWLGVGHVDELFNLVPTGAEPCDMAVLYASPGLGLELAKDVGPAESLGPWGGSEREALAKKETCLENFPRVTRGLGSFWSRLRIPAGEVLACEPFNEANRQYERLMQEELRIFIAALRRATGCANIETVPLPTLFTPNEQADDYTTDVEATPLHANPVNGVVLGRIYAAPLQAHPRFEAELRTRLGELSVPVEFVDTRSFQNGALHCITNVVRHCLSNEPIR